MAVDSVIFWRHGQTDYNFEGRIQGSSDIPLNATGLGQARLVAPHVASYKPARILASPLQRALVTAQQAAKLLDMRVETDKRFEERHYGLWEGLTREEIQANYPAESEIWRRGGQPEGMQIEDKTALGKRVAEAVYEYAEQMNGGTLLVTAHGAAITAGVAELLGLSGMWGGIAGLDNCHWTLLRYQADREQKWRVVAHNRYLSDIADPVRNYRE
ncbi:probable phosphoglycerate mutase [Actinobaculum suis]|uniref:Histidine phosphatase family protein n=1 Tax=Actinobaculum suis TaxID=1657 RepID=A0A0K9EUN2_9ACTO|nr:histidine phosphatase family protein [Actinobaculum suis]KMY23566.1 hypothetical protein ACU19_03870 [Actinobaculum suis]MDY5153254.1 histidine phosphatase family protein [Actinobaculum suis]OCA96074.1 hypothetical protein ACU20_03455 [Actinobaculum suis]OCA96194.1 hypothetical protein ACU21_02610 [Actinobaculum suis]SDE56871.1 probable phosphoglycerate mutase [Actinobaculum suis]